jgi:hypothetical protein
MSPSLLFPDLSVGIQESLALWSQIRRSGVAVLESAIFSLLMSILWRGSPVGLVAGRTKLFPGLLDDLGDDRIGKTPAGQISV